MLDQFVGGYHIDSQVFHKAKKHEVWLQGKRSGGGNYRVSAKSVFSHAWVAFAWFELRSDMLAFLRSAGLRWVER